MKFLLLLLGACAAHAPQTPTAAPAQPDAVVAAPDALAPRPFTPEQIRAAMPLGAVLRFRMEVAGEAPVEERWEVVAANETACTLSSRLFNPDTGALVEDQGDGTSTWAELAGHASFPAADTAVSDSEADVPAGHFATRLYDVQGQDQGQPTRSRYHFALELPGPPVLFTTEVAGTEVFRMALLERSPRPAGNPTQSESGGAP